MDVNKAGHVELLNNVLAPNLACETEAKVLPTEPDDGVDYAEKVAQEILSPRPPPDDIGPDEFAALVVAGPVAMKRISAKSSGTSSLSGSTQKLTNSPSRASLPLAIHCNISNQENSQLISCKTTSASLPSQADSKTKVRPIVRPGSSIWYRLFSCVSSHSHENKTKPSLSPGDNLSSVSSKMKIRSSLFCGCFSRKSSDSNSLLTCADKIACPMEKIPSVILNGDIHTANTVESIMPIVQTTEVDHVEESNNGYAAMGSVLPAVLLPPLLVEDRNKKCFVIDLDETLVHSSFAVVPNADFKIGVDIDGKLHQVYVLKRPHVDIFLQAMASLYECVLFTASLSKYADPVTDLIDPNKVFRHRLFRESCCFYNGNYVKDLNQLGRDVTQTVILDNSPVSYLFHSEYAVHIISWFDNPEDNALLDLIPFFEALAVAPNVPQFLAHNPPPSSATGMSPRLLPSLFPTYPRSYFHQYTMQPQANYGMHPVSLNGNDSDVGNVYSTHSVYPGLVSLQPNENQSFITTATHSQQESAIALGSDAIFSSPIVASVDHSNPISQVMPSPS